MLRRLTILTLIALAIASVSFAGDAPWFDMQNCDMCKNMSPELMKATIWDQANISNGIVCVTTVPTKDIDAYRTAHAGMMKTADRMMKGEQLHLCGSCIALGQCMMQNPHQEYAETATGDVWIITSDNAELVAQLQAWAKRNSEEMAKMMEKGHEGGVH